MTHAPREFGVLTFTQEKHWRTKSLLAEIHGFVERTQREERGAAFDGGSSDSGSAVSVGVIFDDSEHLDLRRTGEIDGAIISAKPAEVHLDPRGAHRPLRCGARG